VRPRHQLDDVPALVISGPLIRADRVAEEQRIEEDLAVLSELDTATISSIPPRALAGAAEAS